MSPSCEYFQRLMQRWGAHFNGVGLRIKYIFRVNKNISPTLFSILVEIFSQKWNKFFFFFKFGDTYTFSVDEIAKGNWDGLISIGDECIVFGS